MSKGGGSSTNTVQKADPWIGAQPALTSLYQNALDNYTKGGPQYYPGETVAPTAPATNAALDATAARAASGSPITDAAKNYTIQSILGQYLPQDSKGQGTYGTASVQYPTTYKAPTYAGAPLFGGASNINANDQIATDAFKGFATGANIGNNTANPYLNQGASGYYLDNQNPYLSSLYKSATDPLVDQFKNATAPGLASQFSLAGRTGSGAAQAANQGAATSLANGLGTASANIYGAAYENERNRQQQNINTLSGNYNTEQGNQLQGANSLAQQAAGQRANALATAQLEFQNRGLDSQNKQYYAGLNSANQNAANALNSQNFNTSNALNSQNYNALNALNAATRNYGLGLQAQSNQFAPYLAQNDYADFAKLFGVGQTQQQIAQQQIDANRARYDFAQNQPQINLQNLSALLTGSGQYASQNKNVQSNNSLLQNLLGGASLYNAGNTASGGAFNKGVSGLFADTSASTEAAAEATASAAALAAADEAGVEGGSIYAAALL